MASFQLHRRCGRRHTAQLNQSDQVRSACIHTAPHCRPAVGSHLNGCTSSHDLGVAFLQSHVLGGRVAVGFHVTCSGADFLSRLSRDANGFFGEPHALYMIGLATVVDETAIKWFVDHEMALDSVTGPFAAFVLFYNEARFSVRNPYARLYQHEDLGEQGDTDQSLNIPMAGAILRQGGHAVDEVLRYRRDVLVKSDILVTSMTYESDAIARQLGILDRLPCIVVFDNPQSGEFYVVSLTDPETAFVEARALLGSFFSDPDNANFLKLLLNWRDIKNRVDVLGREILATTGTYKFRDPERVERSLRDARLALENGKAKAFRTILSTMPSSSYLPWQELRRASDRIHKFRGLAGKLDGLAGRPDLRGHYEYEAAEILGATRSQDRSHDTNDAALLRELANNETEEVMRRLYGYFGFPGDGTWSESGILVAKRAEISALNAAAEETIRVIGQMDRPSLARQFKSLQSRRRRNDFIQKMHSSAIAVADKGPSLMNVITTATSVISHI